jgi:hypothetical protein
MQIKATANFDTIQGQLTGGVVLTVEWSPDSEHEQILLKHLLSDGAHASATVASANFGPKFISTVKLSDGDLNSARAEMALYSEWKQLGGNYRRQHVSFDTFKTLREGENAAAAPVNAPAPVVMEAAVGAVTSKAPAPASTAPTKPVPHIFGTI